MKKRENREKGMILAAVRPRKLSKREKEVAEKLGIKVKTVETHRANIMNKLAFRNVAQLIRYAIQKGLTSVDIE